MASTQQSAQEFLGNGHNLLTGSHLNCDPVIEALNQCKFFKTHELNSIESAEITQDKIKIILDLVISKGEEACYKFLKILDKKDFKYFQDLVLGLQIYTTGLVASPSRKNHNLIQQTKQVGNKHRNSVFFFFFFFFL